MTDITRFFPAFVAQPGGHARLGCCSGCAYPEENDDASTPLLSKPGIHDISSDPASLSTSQYGIMHNKKNDGDKRYRAVRQALTLPKESRDGRVHDGRNCTTNNSATPQTTTQPPMRHGGRKCTTNNSATTQTTTELQISTAVQTLPPELASIAIQTRVVRDDLIAISMPDLRTATTSSMCTVGMPPLPKHIGSAVDFDGTVNVGTLITLFSKLLPSPSVHIAKQPSQNRKTTTRYKPNTSYKSRRLLSAVRLSPNVSSEPFLGVRATIRKMKLAEEMESRERYENGDGDELLERQNHSNTTYIHRHVDDEKDKRQFDCRQFRHKHPQVHVVEASQSDYTEAAIDHRHCLLSGDISRATLPSIANISREVHGLARFRQMIQIHRRPDKRTSRDTL